ncbi:hypothetical protein [Streptomyces sp. NPDC058202]|uniref:hypothetical protein n=1 Tax=Streptomyces sp. NPDC058202 TaxID=3346380 RepID=UPI0036E3F2EF
MNDHLTLLDGLNPQPAEQNTKWFRVTPPKHVRAEIYRKIKAVRRPPGSLALPSIAATAALHFSHTVHGTDSLMAFGLTTLTVAYDAVHTLSHTHLKTHTDTSAQADTPAGQRAA